MNMQPAPLRLALSALFVCATVITLLSWAGHPQNPLNISGNDTIPKREKATRQPGDKDFDKELRQLDEAENSLDKITRKDWDKIGREIDESLKSIDFDKIKIEVQKSINAIDVEKIQQDVQDAIRKIDFDKIGKEIDKAMEEVSASIDKADIEKLKSELDKARVDVRDQFNSAEFKKSMEEIKKIDFKSIEKELEEARNDVLKAKDEIQLEKLDIHKEMEKANENIADAKKELKGYQEMIYEMESDGLLNTNNDYSISYLNGELSVNGKKQSPTISTKYKKYFRHDLTIKKKDGHMDIDHED